MAGMPATGHAVRRKGHLRRWRYLDGPVGSAPAVHRRGRADGRSLGDPSPSGRPLSRRSWTPPWPRPHGERAQRRLPRPDPRTPHGSFNGVQNRPVVREDRRSRGIWRATPQQVGGVTVAATNARSVEVKARRGQVANREGATSPLVATASPAARSRRYEGFQGRPWGPRSTPPPSQSRTWSGGSRRRHRQRCPWPLRRRPLRLC